MTFKPHWTSGEDTYVTEPPDQLQSRGYIPDDVPTAEETNWIFRNLMPFRVFESPSDALDALTAGQSGYVLGDMSIGSAVLDSKALTYGTTTAYLATDGENVYVAKDDGSTQTVITAVSCSTLDTVQTFEAGAGAPLSVATDGVYVVAVTSTHIRFWDAETGLLLGGTSVLSTPRQVIIHGKYAYIACNGHARQFSLSTMLQTGVIDHDADVVGVCAHGHQVYFVGAASGGGGDTSTGTCYFVADVSTGFSLMPLEAGFTGTPKDVATDGKYTYVTLDDGGTPKLFRQGLMLADSQEEMGIVPFSGTTRVEAANGWVLIADSLGMCVKYADSDALYAVINTGSYAYDAAWPAANTAFITDGFYAYSWYAASETLYKVRLPKTVPQLVYRRADYSDSQHPPCAIRYPNLLLQPL